MRKEKCEEDIFEVNIRGRPLRGNVCIETCRTRGTYACKTPQSNPCASFTVFFGDCPQGPSQSHIGQVLNMYLNSVMEWNTARMKGEERVCSIYHMMICPSFFIPTTRRLWYECA